MIVVEKYSSLVFPDNRRHKQLITFADNTAPVEENVVEIVSARLQH